MVLSTPGFEPSPLKEVTWGSRFKSRYDWKKICLHQDSNPHPWSTNLEVWGSNPVVVEKVLSKPGFEPTPFRSKVQIPVWSEKSVVHTRIRTHTFKVLTLRSKVQIPIWSEKSAIFPTVYYCRCLLYSIVCLFLILIFSYPFLLHTPYSVATVDSPRTRIW